MRLVSLISTICLIVFATSLHLPVQSGGVARTADEAVAWADEIDYPVAVKLASHRIVHKRRSAASF